MVRCWGEDSRSAGHKPCGMSHWAPSSDLVDSKKSVAIPCWRFQQLEPYFSFLMILLSGAPTLLSEKLNQLMMQILWR